MYDQYFFFALGLLLCHCRAKDVSIALRLSEFIIAPEMPALSIGNILRVYEDIADFMILIYLFQQYYYNMNIISTLLHYLD